MSNFWKAGEQTYSRSCSWGEELEDGDQEKEEALLPLAHNLVLLEFREREHVSYSKK